MTQFHNTIRILHVFAVKFEITDVSSENCHIFVYLNFWLTFCASSVRYIITVLSGFFFFMG
jgi:hypothetical protein